MWNNEILVSFRKRKKNFFSSACSKVNHCQTKKGKKNPIVTDFYFFEKKMFSFFLPSYLRTTSFFYSLPSSTTSYHYLFLFYFLVDEKKLKFMVVLTNNYSSVFTLLDIDAEKIESRSSNVRFHILKAVL